LTWGFFADRLSKFRRTGPDRARAQCPAHDGDGTDTLSIEQGREWWLLYCWSRGCSTESISRSLGLALSDLSLEDRP
jgi:hypothetical protein